MKSNSFTKPPVFESLGNGAFYYNYNIVESEITDENGEVKTSFDYDQVKVWGNPDRQKCVKAIIREAYDETEEFNMVNKYNAYTMGLSDNVADKAEYEDYLRFIASIKNIVSKDFNE